MKLRHTEKLWQKYLRSGWLAYLYRVRRERTARAALSQDG